MRRPSSILAAFAGSLAITLVLPAFAQPVPEPQPPRDGYFDTVHVCIPDEHGRLHGGKMQIWVDRSDTRLRPFPADVESLTPMNNPRNRIDLVFVGDGYTAPELGLYSQHVNNMVAAFFAKEPFVTYGPLFNVHRVDVISNESGVSHDPTYPLWRDTALEMRFWCNNTERLLCVNVNRAYQYANNAPDVDLVAAIANSTKYGGAGYITSNLGTASGGNSWSPEILLHEFGHALGNLADEYHYSDQRRYTGNERPESNVSILEESQMAQQNRKWAAWLGVNDPRFDGRVGTFEGAYYHQFGIYRPTNNSIMRSLGRPFNLPSIEATIIEMYRIVDPIDDASEEGTYRGTERLWVQPVEPQGHALDVQWFLDGQPIPDATTSTLDLCTLNLTGTHAVEVVVTDNTEWVRNEAARAQWLTDSRRYTVRIDSATRDFGLWGPQPGIAGQVNTLGATCVTPGARVHFIYSFTAGQTSVPGCPATTVDLRSPVIAGATRADASGEAIFQSFIPPAASGRTVLIQAVEAGACRVSNVVERRLE